MRVQSQSWDGSLPDKKGSFTRCHTGSTWQKNIDFHLDTPFEEYPEEIQDILIHGTDGREVKVHYHGQRGEGVLRCCI